MEACFDHLEPTAKRLNAAIQHLLSMLRIKEATLIISEVDPSQIYKKVMDSMKYVKGFDIVKFYNQIEPCSLFTDKFLLESILQNLIENYIKYRNLKGEQWVKVLVVMRDDLLLIEVEDNGQGIPEEMKEKVFDMFFRGNETSDGNGLGLYVIKSSINKMDREIELESEGGIGTMVIIR